MYVCLFVTFVSPAKTDELIEMPLKGLTRVVPKNHVLDESLDRKNQFAVKIDKSSIQHFVKILLTSLPLLWFREADDRCCSCTVTQLSGFSAHAKQFVAISFRKAAPPDTLASLLNLKPSSHCTK